MVVTVSDHLKRVGPFKLFLLGLVIYAAGSVGIMAVSALIGNSVQIIVSDGKGYYSWLRSVAIDGDINFANDYRLIYPPDPLPPEAEKLTPAGLTVNKYPTGVAILEAPGFFVGHLIAKLFSSTNGISAPYQLAICGWLVAFFLFSCWFIFKAIKNFGGDEWSALIAVGVALTATNVIHYVAKEPAMTHLAGFSLISLLIFLVSKGKSRATTLALGIALGILLLVRNSNIAFIPFICLLSYIRGFDLRSIFVVLGLGCLVTMIQPISLWFLWGEFRLSTYHGEGFTSGFHGMWNALFSSRHGLFIYHPWYLTLIVVNIWASIWGDGIGRKISIGATLTFGIIWLFNGLWWNWWFGDSFGNRAFIESLVPLTLGFALYIPKVSEILKKRSLVPTAVLCILILIASNIYIWGGYLLHRYPHDGNHSVMDVYAWILR